MDAEIRGWVFPLWQNLDGLRLKQAADAAQAAEAKAQEAAGQMNKGQQVLHLPACAPQRLIFLILK